MKKIFTFIIAMFFTGSMMAQETMTPTNCAEAAAAAWSVSKNNELYNDGAVYTINGYVTAIQTAFNAQYSNVSFWLADEKGGTNTIQAYRAACGAAEDAPAVGDRVSVTGSLTKYGTTPEFAAGCTFTIIERADEGPLTINTDVFPVNSGQVIIQNDTLLATPNYGYHFVQWNDSVTENPRTIELTQDTSFTAIFVKNTYAVTTAANNAEWGTTTGDAYVLYQEQSVIQAMPNYGYHFVRWNDGDSSNPRSVVVTQDTTYTATFAKNQYYITKISDLSQGSISDLSRAEYLDTVTLEAMPEYGYKFLRWSDGIKDNPRTFVLTQDTSFTAEFGYTVAGSCGDNNQLTWTFDSISGTLSISGEGTLGSNYMYGLQAPTQATRLIIEEGVTNIGNYAFNGMGSTINSLALPTTLTNIGDCAFAGFNNRKFNTLVLPNDIISIGAHAFDGASYVQTIYFGSLLEEIGEAAFNGCTRVRKMTCLAEITPNVGTDGLISISSLAELYVPNEYLFDYQIDNNWNRFVLKPIGATDATVTNNEVTVVADDNTATLTWPTSENADSYSIEITKDGVVFCTLIFNANGQLTGIAFAPSRNGQPHAPAATMTANGMQFTVTGLNSGTNYAFNVAAKNGETVLASYSGEFTTTGVATAIDNIDSSSLQGGDRGRLIYRNDQILILRGNKTYTLQGQEVK